MAAWALEKILGEGFRFEIVNEEELPGWKKEGPSIKPTQPGMNKNRHDFKDKPYGSKGKNLPIEKDKEKVLLGGRPSDGAPSAAQKEDVAKQSADNHPSLDSIPDKVRYFQCHVLKHYLANCVNSVSCPLKATALPTKRGSGYRYYDLIQLTATKGRLRCQPNAVLSLHCPLPTG